MNKYRIKFFKAAAGFDADIMTGICYIDAENIDTVHAYIEKNQNNIKGFTPFFEILKVK